MINFNGSIVKNESIDSLITNRGFKYGDALFETLKVVNSKILFWEDHYFRLMASMRILRMEIPMDFTMEFLESEILKLITQSDQINTIFKVRLYVNRAQGGLYLPETNEINYFITSEPLNNKEYSFDENNYVVDLYKDHYVNPGLLSTLKTNNKVLHVIANIYAKENNLDNCLLLNTNKNVVELTNGNIFLVSGNTVKTPPILDGCLKGIIRKQVIDIIMLDTELRIIEDSISPFELQKADELFMTNVITGIQPITKYRKKNYNYLVSKKLIRVLNEKLIS